VEVYVQVFTTSVLPSHKQLACRCGHLIGKRMHASKILGWMSPRDDINFVDNGSRIDCIGNTTLP
jgi:hypothetical protein